MRDAFSFILVSIAACIFGIGSAQIVLDSELEFNKVTLGQWEIWPTAGEPDADPYTKAYLARKGTVWMGVTEGLILFARNDTGNDRLNGQCIYTLSGRVPRGRLWTLTSQTASSASNPPAPQVHFITSNDIIWEEDGQLIITISQNVQPGNWLQVDSNGDFHLVLRIYDTPLTTGALDAAIITPSIIKGDCA